MSVLYLAPTLLSENTELQVIPTNVINIVHSLRQFVVEDVRTARRFLSKIKYPGDIQKLSFKELNEQTKKSEIPFLLPFLQLENTGVLTEAGAPGIADPGAEVVKLAHDNHIKVVPLVGPSSILMALMASGLNGQSFAFVGYLPIKTYERQKRLKELEKRSSKEKQTQIFIETPYRNNQLLNDILQTCSPDTMITIASDITGAREKIFTKNVKEWKTRVPELNKIPTVFLLQAEY